MNDELLVKFLLSETSPEENREVELWLAASEANRKQFADMELIWNTSKNLAAKSTIDENAAWERFKVKATNQKSEKAPIKLWERYSWMKIAAVLIMICGAWVMYALLGTKKDTLTAFQAPLTQILPDGSEVTLNKNSSLSYSFAANGRQRNVKLQKGEVFFNVSHDKEKPFVIQANKVNITVVGTSFNVKHSGIRTEVIVETGIVRVSKDKQVVELHKGQKVVVENGKLNVLANTDQLYKYYRNKEIIADNTPLWRVVEVLNEAYNTQISIENSALRDVTLTTSFRNESLDRILEVIGETINCKVIKQGDKYILK